MGGRSRRRLDWFSQVPLSMQSLQDDGESQDIYDRYLTQAEIQGNVNHVNGEREGPRGALGVLSG